MDRELLRLGGSHSLGQAAHLLNLDLPLDLLFVDVVNGLVSNYQRALLRPIKHISFLDLVGKEQLLPLQKGHRAGILLKANKVFHWKRLQGNGRCVNHLK